MQLAEKGLQTYERDGWGEYDTQIVPERREIRPTADRGPILLCVDTSGSMRGPRETVAKALALECMRAARAQVSLLCICLLGFPCVVAFELGPCCGHGKLCLCCWRVVTGLVCLCLTLEMGLC